MARVLVLAVAWLWFFGGDGVLSTTGVPSTDGVRLAAAGLWLFVAATTAMGAPRSLDDVTAGTELVLAAGVRATVAAAFVVTAVETATAFLVLIGFGMIALTMTAPAPVLGAGLGVLAVVVGVGSALAAGFAAGVGFQPFLGRLPVVSSRPRAAFAPVLIVVVLALLRPDVVGPAFRVLPPAFLADVLLVAFDAGQPVAGALALVGGVLAVPAFGLLGERAARTVWFDGDDVGASASRRGRRLVAAGVGATAPFTRRPTRAVATRAWLRMLRNPQTLFQLAVPVFMLAATVVQDPGQFGTALPVLVAAFAGISAGLTLTLNPLALEGDALPALLTTPVAGATVVRGYVLAGVLAAAPTLLVLVPPVAFVTPLDPAVTVLVVAWGVVVAAFGALLSTAIGFLVPSTGALADGEAQAPTQAAVVAYTTVAFVAVAPGIAGLLALDASLGRALLAGDVLLLATVGGLAYRSVAGRYASLTVDD